MPGYRLTPDAQKDLIDIRRFTVTRWGADQSRKYLTELRQVIRLLTDNPSLGTARSEISSGVLSFPHGSHIIYCHGSWPTTGRFWRLASTDGARQSPE